MKRLIIYSFLGLLFSCTFSEDDSNDRAIEEKKRQIETIISRRKEQNEHTPRGLHKEKDEIDSTTKESIYLRLLVQLESDFTTKESECLAFLSGFEDFQNNAEISQFQNEILHKHFTNYKSIIASCICESDKVNIALIAKGLANPVNDGFREKGLCELLSIQNCPRLQNFCSQSR